MANFDKNRFASKNQSFETPDELFHLVDDMFHFTTDVCASAENTKCSSFYSEENSCLDKEWSGVCWMNPPFKDMKKFIKKAFDESGRAVTVCLIPARTNTKWWHELCMNGEIWFLEGRPKFKGCIHGLPQPLALVVFGRGQKIMQSFSITKGLLGTSGANK